jgi:hypothetical protein
VDLSRREVAGALQVLDPTRSRRIPLALVVEEIVDKAGSGGAGIDGSGAKGGDDKEKQEAEAAAAARLKEKEAQRIAHHIYGVATDGFTMAGAGGLRRAFHRFDPRRKGVLSREAVCDALNGAGCNVIDEEVELLLQAMPGGSSEGKKRIGLEEPVAYEKLIEAVVKLSAQATAPPQGMGRRGRQHQHQAPVRFAAATSPPQSRFFGGGQRPTTIGKHRSGSFIGGGGGGGGGGVRDSLDMMPYPLERSVNHDNNLFGASSSSSSFFAQDHQPTLIGGGLGYNNNASSASIGGGAAPLALASDAVESLATRVAQAIKELRIVQYGPGLTLERFLVTYFDKGGTGLVTIEELGEALTELGRYYIFFRSSVSKETVA